MLFLLKFVGSIWRFSIVPNEKVFMKKGGFESVHHSDKLLLGVAHSPPLGCDSITSRCGVPCQPVPRRPTYHKPMLGTVYRVGIGFIIGYKIPYQMRLSQSGFFLQLLQFCLKCLYFLIEI